MCQPDREARIAELAYLKAESRGFEPGQELEDWLEAEACWRTPHLKGVLEWPCLQNIPLDLIHSPSQCASVYTGARHHS